MQTTRRFFSVLLVALVALFAFIVPFSAPAQVFAGRPKLIVIVVIDQFRGDYLNRDRAQFKGRGFNLFMKEGAWFTDCYYDYANTKTAPGHATIGTGAYTDGHGIESNEWWDASRSYEREGELGRGRALPTCGSAARLDSGESARRAELGDQLGRWRIAAESARHDAGR